MIPRAFERKKISRMQGRVNERHSERGKRRGG